MNIQLTDSAKKALLVFGSGFLLFMLFRKSANKIKNNVGDGTDLPFDGVPEPKNRKKVPNPKLNPKDVGRNKKAKDALTALKAFIAAYNAGESQAALNELNREISKEMGLRVYRKASTGNFIVTDLSGKEIMSNG